MKTVFGSGDLRQWGTARWVLLASLALGCSSEPGVVTATSWSDPETEALVEDDPEVPWGETGLLGLWGSSADDLWAVGQEGTILHDDGTGWAIVDSGTTRDLISVVGSGPDELWIGGDDIVLRGDGDTWQMELEYVFELILGAWSGTENQVWLSGVATDVNSGLIRHWDGEHWHVAVSSAASSLWAIWGSATDTLWTGGSASPGPEGFLVRGGAEPFDLIGYPGMSPRGIWGSSETDVWVAAYDGDFHHYDGTTWEAVAGRTDELLTAMHGTGSDDVWVVGLHGAILHYDGAAWTVVPSGTTEHLFGVWAAATDDVWAVGGKGTILHYDGEAWAACGVTCPE